MYFSLQILKLGYGSASNCPPPPQEVKELSLHKQFILSPLVKST